MLNFLSNIFKSRMPADTGAIGDGRTESQIENAFDSRELVTAFPLEWKEKKEWKSYPVKRQYYTGECVAQSTAKHLGINHEADTGFYANLSPGFFYSFRENKGTPGMNWGDAMKIATTVGSCLDAKVKQRVRDSDPEIVPTDEMKKEALRYRGKAHFEVKERTLESVAQVIEQHGSCPMWFWFDVDGKEWWKPDPSIIYPDLGTYDKGATRHAVIATDYGIRNGKKVLKIEDSAGNSSAISNQDRFIDENFMKRCFISGYIVDIPDIDFQGEKPKWSGNRELRVGMSGEDVKDLQKILKYHDCFDYDIFTGYFGGYTRVGVIKLQEKFQKEILAPVGLTKGTGIVASQTLKWLNNNHK